LDVGAQLRIADFGPGRGGGRREAQPERRRAAQNGLKQPHPATPVWWPDPRRSHPKVQPAKRLVSNGARSPRLFRVHIRSARASPIAAECLKPCPEQAETFVTWLWASSPRMMKLKSGVTV